MSFSFGFKEEELDEEVDNGSLNVYEIPAHVSSDPNHPPKVVELASILQQLVDVTVSLTRCTTETGNEVYKRELFDIKHQVMTEDDDKISAMVLTNESDLKKNVYEGGFKVWEGSFDLIDELTNQNIDLTQSHLILEIGSGTSLPSSYILGQRIRLGQYSNPLTLVLSDFNYDVLRLVTVPNIIINWYLATHDPTDQIRLTSEVLDQFSDDLKKYNISLHLVEGSWCDEFLTLIGQFDLSLILTAETIYSLDSLPILTKILIQSVTKAPHVQALIAAKNYYFGVGGSVIEFTNYIKHNSTLKLDVHEVNSHLKRSLIRLYH